MQRASIPMRILYPLVITALSIAGCAKTGPDLRQPVGQTMVQSARLPSTPHGDAAGGQAASPDAEGYLTGKSAGPCGMEEFPIVEFASGSSDVGQPQNDALRKLAGCLTAAPFGTTSVVLVGYSDPMGTVTANLSLGLKRAQSVMTRLIDNGVSPSRIVIASAGELQRPSSRWGLGANRVEVLIARGGPPRPNEAPIVRGIEAEGLVPRRPNPAATATAAQTAPPAKAFVPQAPVRAPAPPSPSPPPPRGQ